MKKSILLLMTISALTLSTNGLKAAAAAEDSYYSDSDKSEGESAVKTKKETTAAPTYKIKRTAPSLIAARWRAEDITKGLKLCSDIDELTKQIDSLQRNKRIASAIIDKAVKARDFSTLKALLYPDTKSPPPFAIISHRDLANWIKRRLDELYPSIDPELLKLKISDLKTLKQALYRSFKTEDYIFCEQILISASAIKNSILPPDETSSTEE